MDGFDKNLNQNKPTDEQKNTTDNENANGAQNNESSINSDNTGSENFNGNTDAKSGYGSQTDNTQYNNAQNNNTQYGGQDGNPYGNPYANQQYSQYNNSQYNGNQQYNEQNNNTQNNNTEDSNQQYSQYGGNIQYKWNYDDYQNALDNNKKKENKKKRGLKPFIITVCCVFGIAVLGLAGFGISNAVSGRNPVSSSKGTNANSNTKIDIEAQPKPSKTTTSGKELTNEEVAEKLTPAVVGIEMYNLSSVEPIAEGSGIVISEDGYVVTNAHVVADGQKACVVMSDGKKYDTVKVVGTDTKSDLAVLKINATGLTKATFGDSSTLKVGQAVVAIGNPGGLTFANTVTDGIVSGLNRTVSSSSGGAQMKYIQTNALINPGNSGGPLVNMYGQVVGINTAKISQSGYEGIGFAIPISTAKPYIDSIIANGYVTGRVKVGISVYALSESQAKWYNYPSGLYIDSIDKTSDAYAKGLRTKDIITQINGTAIADSDASKVYSKFYDAESKFKAGDTITVTVYRTGTGKTATVSFRLEEDKGDTDSTNSSSQNQNQNSNGYGNSDQNGNDDFFSQFTR